MVETLTYGAVSGRVGGGAMAFDWIVVGIIGLLGIMTLVMIMSISLIRKLTEED